MASLRCLRAPWLNQAVLPRPRLRHAFDRQAIYSKEAAKEAISTEQLNAVWEEHLKHEFSTKDTEETIRTMVRSPHTHRFIFSGNTHLPSLRLYKPPCNLSASPLPLQVPHASVNHVPTLTGGRGHEELRQFYSQSFIPAFPSNSHAHACLTSPFYPATTLRCTWSVLGSSALACPGMHVHVHLHLHRCHAGDTKTVPVHRVVGSSAIVDEMVMEFTHDQEVSLVCLFNRAPIHASQCMLRQHAEGVAYMPNWSH